MSRSSLPKPTPRLSRRQILLATAAAGAGSLLAACGGGGSDGSDDTAGSFTTGPITGFGSIIVGGVRFDDSRAEVVDEDGDRRGREHLKLGCIVDVDGGIINRALASALALRIALGGALVGPVGVVDKTASTITVIGQTVLVTESTIFDDSIVGGLDGITAGDVLEVHGLYDRVNVRFVATRIEPKPGATEYRLRGVVSDLDTDAKTFRIGSELINYGSVPAAEMRAQPVEGQFIRVRLQIEQVDGAWVATRMGSGVRRFERHHEAHVEGIITALTSPESFEVNGLKVDASGAEFPDGKAGIVVGARVEVEGAIVDGVLVAKEVELEDRHEFGRRSFELHGLVSGLNKDAKTFALRGLTIWYGGSVAYRNGTEADLADGRRVEVLGVVAPDRRRIEALRIEFE